MQDAQTFPATIDPNLAAQLKSGAGWFYWIAALSLVNSLLFLFGSELGFPLGLLVTIFFDGLGPVAVEQGAPAFVKYVGLVLNIPIYAFTAAFGFFAARGHGWAFIIGAVLYSIDTLLHLALGSVISFGIHVFALIFIIRGYLACRTLSKLPPPPTPNPPSPDYSSL